MLKSKTNARNKIEAINSRVISPLRYGAEVIVWAVDVLNCIERRTRNLLIKYGICHPKGNTDKLYVLIKVE